MVKYPMQVANVLVLLLSFFVAPLEFCRGLLKRDLRKKAKLTARTLEVLAKLIENDSKLTEKRETKRKSESYKKRM